VKKTSAREKRKSCLSDQTVKSSYPPQGVKKEEQALHMEDTEKRKKLWEEANVRIVC